MSVVRVPTTVMEIYYVANFDCSEAKMSGEASHVRGIVRALAEEKCSLVLFANGWTSKSGDTVEFVYVPLVKTPGLFALSFGLFSPFVIGLRLLRQRPDFIVARYHKFILLLLIVSKLFRIQLILEVNSDIRSERLVAGSGALRNRVESWLEKLSYRAASGIVAVSNSVGDSIRARFPALTTPVEIVANGVDTAIYYPRPRAECCRALAVDLQRQTIAFVGAFQKYQGIPTLLEALALLKVTNPSILLLLVGDGPDRAVVEQLTVELGLGEHVQYFGWRPDTESAIVIGASHLCVAPYNRLAAGTTEDNPGKYGAALRGSPLKVFTYLACGRALVSTHFREVGVFAEGIGAGLAVPPEDVNALAAAIRELLNDPARADKMGEQGAQAISGQYGWDATARHLLRFLQRVQLNSGMAS